MTLFAHTPVFVNSELTEIIDGNGSDYSAVVYKTNREQVFSLPFLISGDFDLLLGYARRPEGARHMFKPDELEAMRAALAAQGVPVATVDELLALLPKVRRLLEVGLDAPVFPAEWETAQ